MGLTACQAKPPIMASAGSHPFIGCWESEDGLARETWDADPSGWLFGYALNRNEVGEVTFFEQMRLETKANETNFVVTAGTGPSVTFKQVENGPAFIFENPDHDYPQRITYIPGDGVLKANISMMDGSNIANFDKTSCR